MNNRWVGSSGASARARNTPRARRRDLEVAADPTGGHTASARSAPLHEVHGVEVATAVVGRTGSVHDRQPVLVPEPRQRRATGGTYAGVTGK